MTTSFARHSGPHGNGCEKLRERPWHGRHHLPAVAGVTGFAIAFLLFTNGAFANEEAILRYPATKQDDAIEERFGTVIPDPYRWLETDIRRNAEVARWVDQQNVVSAPYLSGLPGRQTFQERLMALFAHERLSTPMKRGERYFFYRQSAMDNQGKLVARSATDGSDQVVIDPNEWSEDGTSALGTWSVSTDGRHVAFSIHEDGADWGTIRVLDIDGNAMLEDEIEWARFTSIAWLEDGSGFFYARNPEPEADATFGAPTLGHAIYFHRVGDPQSQDQVVHAPEAALPLIHTVKVTESGSHAVIMSTPLSGGNSVSVIDLRTSDWAVRPLIESVEHGWSLVGEVDSKLFLTSSEGAGRGKIVCVNLALEKPTFETIVPEQREAVLLGGRIAGDRLLVSHMVDAKSEVRRFTLDGRPDGRVVLPGIGTAGAFEGRVGEDEAFFLFSSYDAPTTIYRYDVASNTSSIWAEADVAADLASISVEQRFYTSKDGTEVPISIVRRKDVTQAAPTMLTGYGGFGIPMVPFFSPEAIAWVEQGGVYAVANIRGGGEYGRAWHDAGRLRNKQNVFDDFIAASEFLKREGITSKDGLAIHGGSNGGLLIGAVVNQRPDLYAAALPDVGVMDMLRFDRFTGGSLWMQEYGDPANEADFRTLLSYSPLHNIRAGVDYPAILVTTADTDDRVVPAHSFKYAAALQAARIGNRPHLLRVESRAGHGAGKPTDKIVEQAADMWAFAARWTGLDVAKPD